MSKIDVSIIVPCRNETKFIAQFLDSLLANDCPKLSLEIIIADGMSDDGTRDIIQSYISEHPEIILLDNLKKITPTALNLGIMSAKGEVIMRMDVHAKYPSNYINALVSALFETQADNVGTVCVTLPENNTLIAQAIATAMSHPFGVGNSYFRIGVSERRWVDTVPFGCYRREIFERIGLYDEELLRNQDDELNLRLIKHGGKILLLPEIVTYYYARDSIAKLWKMYYQYGYYKPLVALKLGGFYTLRQLVPAALVASLSVLSLLAPWFSVALALDSLLVTLYLAAILFVSGMLALRSHKISSLVLPLIFPVIHIAYGCGFLLGFFQQVLGRKFSTGTIGQDMDLSR